VDAAGVSFVDGLIVRGSYQLRPLLPYTSGLALAGRVVVRGRGVEDVAIGARVAGCLMDYGAYASHVALPVTAGRCCRTR
jgi:NADPH2:quinone reductase